MTDPRDRTPAMTSPTTLTAAAEPVVTLEDASFSYGSSTVLTGVSGRVPAGQALALVGPNGSGKTTLMRALLGMVTVSRGRVRVNGAAPGRAPRGSVGYVPQLSDLDPTFPVTVREVVQMGMYSQLGILRRPGAQTRRRALDALKSVGLADRAERRFGTLSGGQQQPNREALLSIITDLKDQGISLIISTHDLVLAQETCEQVALLAGRQIAFGPRDEVLVARYIDEAYGGHGTTRLLGLRSGAGTQEPS